MGSPEESVVWDKSEQLLESEDEVWDDRMLIDAYQRASKKVDSALAGHLSDAGSRSTSSSKGRGSSAKNRGKKRKPWKVGHYCRCLYSEDSVEYEAQLIKLTDRGSCVVRYLGYGNEETKLVTDLKPTLGNQAREAQEREVRAALEVPVAPGAASLDCPESLLPPHPTHLASLPTHGVTNRKRGPAASPLLPPPPPPSFLASSGAAAPQEEEALASMLMSWYMSGYHTGYYRALKQFKSQCKCTQNDKL